MSNMVERGKETLRATGVILAGGKSTRMGSDKAFLNLGRQEIIKRIAGELQSVFDEVLVVEGDADKLSCLGLKPVPDLIRGGGPLSGIYAALMAARYDKCFVVACDMPFITSALARYVCHKAEGYDVVVPRHGLYLQPLFAIYRKTCINNIEESLRAFRYKIVDFYPSVLVNYVDEEELGAFADIDKIFFNINTPEDLEKARNILCRTGKVAV